MKNKRVKKSDFFCLLVDDSKKQTDNFRKVLKQPVNRCLPIEKKVYCPRVSSDHLLWALIEGDFLFHRLE